jgi:hypothetical protein
LKEVFEKKQQEFNEMKITLLREIFRQTAEEGHVVQPGINQETVCFMFLERLSDLFAVKRDD